MSIRNTLGAYTHRIKLDVVRAVVTPAVAFRTKRLIVFLTPGWDAPSGGIISIASIYRESAAIQHLHGAKVAICTIPDEPPLLKYTWFKNRNYLLDLEKLLKRCGDLDHLMIHIPEYTVNRFSDWLGSHWSKLVNIKDVHLNVMVQHIDLMDNQDLNQLSRYGKVTCTTAHESYSDTATRERFGVALHRLSCCNGPENYVISDYTEKQPLLMVSHDKHPLKEKVILQIKKALPELKVQVIENISFEEYLDVARRAKWSLTFGEGLDSYFCDPVFCGGVSFAVFNDRFFTPPFKNLETVYPSWDVLLERLTTDLKRLDEPIAYKRCWGQAWDLLNDLYSNEGFRENLRKFYRSEYTFP